MTLHKLQKLGHMGVGEAELWRGLEGGGGAILLSSTIRPCRLGVVEVVEVVGVVGVSPRASPRGSLPYRRRRRRHVRIVLLGVVIALEIEEGSPQAGLLDRAECVSPLLDQDGGGGG